MSSDPLWALWGVYPMPVLDESPLLRLAWRWRAHRTGPGQAFEIAVM